jgi:hypothetical protein
MSWKLDRGAVVRGPGHGDLELARQVAELGMQRGPLAQDFGDRPRIDDLVGGGAGELVGGDVADAIARGLDGVHLDAGEVVEDVGHVAQLGPVELDVLARGEMAVAAVVGARDVREHAHLPRRQRAVGNGDAQHVGVQLQVEPVHQPERPELVLVELARQARGSPGRGTARCARARTGRSNSS